MDRLMSWARPEGLRLSPAAWVASATRYLEAQQVRWFPDAPGERVDGAAVTALSSVAALVEKHVNREYGTGPYAR